MSGGYGGDGRGYGDRGQPRRPPSARPPREPWPPRDPQPPRNPPPRNTQPPRNPPPPRNTQPPRNAPPPYNPQPPRNAPPPWDDPAQYPRQYPGSRPRPRQEPDYAGWDDRRADEPFWDGRDDWDDNNNWDDDKGGRRRRGPVRRLAPWIALFVILVPLLGGGWYVWRLYENKYHPADYAGPGTSAVTVQVKSGDTASSLGPRLVTLGVVASTRAFVLAAEHSTKTAGLEPGFYKLGNHMQASLAYAALLNPKDRVQLTVTFREGLRVSQVVALLAKQTSIPQAQFQQIIDHPAPLGLPSYAKGKVEGYLFPATYQIQPNESALQILRAMVGRYDQEASAIDLTAEAPRVNLTPEQVMIEASMAQAEGGSVSDYPKIVRVVINRLAKDMPLQFDSTLLYGLGAYGTNVTFKQIDTPGPYNSFQHKGLPPTPISNPGRSAIEAVLHPANGDWLYFLTVTGGVSKFSATPLPGMR